MRQLTEPAPRKLLALVPTGVSWLGFTVWLLLMNGCAVVPQFIVGPKPPVAPGRTVAKVPGHPAPIPVKAVAQPKASPAPLADILNRAPTNLELSGKGHPRPVTKVDTGFIVRRLALYRQKLAAWNQLAGDLVTLDMGGAWPAGWYGCVQNLEMVFAGYRRLRPDEIANGASAAAALTAYQRDIEYLAGGCDDIMAASQGRLSKNLANARGVIANQAIALVRQYLAQDKNLQAGQAYEHFIKLYGVGAATNELKALYSKALRRQGRLTAALAPLADIWTENTSLYSKEPVALENLGITYADLLLVNGKPEAARKVYEKIAQDLSSSSARERWVNNQLRILDSGEEPSLLTAYTGVLQAYYRFNSRNISDNFTAKLAKINKFGTAAMSANSAIISRRLTAKIAERADRQLAKIAELTGGGEFAQASAIADTLLSFVPADRRPEVVAVSAQIKKAQAAARQARLQLDKQKLARQWQAAEDLLDRREYRAAISTYRQLLTSSYANEARAKIAAAANMAAVEARRKAASLFFKARKADDPQLKRQLLLRSRDILRQIVVEYPDAGIISSIKRNLQVLHTQLTAEPPLPEK
ncbi:MAG: hypothetical protein GXP59_08780 [Deltaproteobacteria bacterium]|nr:hypothetical protein [Deltaproteobacteria bacterium]